MSALVNDALALLDGLDVDAISAAGGKAAEAVALLALVAGQDVEPAEGSDGTDGRWRIARKVAPDRVISTVDPEARHAHKTTERRQDGFKAHVVVEPDTGLTTAAQLTKANGPDNSDATIGAALLEGDTTLPAAAEDAEPMEVLGDSAYGTGEMLEALDKAGHKPVIKPWPTRPAVEGGFTIDDFGYDDKAGTLTCPNGLTRRLSTKRRVTFGAPARCETGAPPHPEAARSPSTATRDCSGTTGAVHKISTSSRPTGRSGRWSNAPSPGWPTVTAESPTEAWPRTTPGSTTVSPPSTFDAC